MLFGCRLSTWTKERSGARSNILEEVEDLGVVVEKVVEEVKEFGSVVEEMLYHIMLIG